MIFNERPLRDASFTVVSCKRNTTEENRNIKKGVRRWVMEQQAQQEKTQNIDARWTKKNGKPCCGYKNT